MSHKPKMIAPDEAESLIVSGRAPDGMYVPGSMEFGPFCSPTFLPKEMYVAGDLTIRDCHSLTSLPEGLEVDGSCRLIRCTALTSMPERFVVRGYLEIIECPSLTSLPESWGVPNIGNIDAMILDALGSGGSLDMRRGHTCETTHSRLGWAVHLSGEDGKRLEERFGTAGAGALLYIASGRPIPDFYASNEEAMRSIIEGARS